MICHLTTMLEISRKCHVTRGNVAKITTSNV